MKVLLLNANQRKGNTYSVLQEIEDVLLKHGLETELVHLPDFHLLTCRACMSCIIHGEDKCPLKDDIDRLITKIDEADGFIFASPTHCFNVSVEAKNLFDRLSWMTHRPLYATKPALLVTTSAGAGHNNCLQNMKTIIGGWEMHISGQIAVSKAPYSMGKKRETKSRNKFDKNLKAFITDVHAPAKSPKLNGLMHFHFLRAHSKVAAEYYPADYRYYSQNGLDIAQYYTDVKVPLYKAAFVGFLEKKIAKMMARDILGGSRIKQ